MNLNQHITISSADNIWISKQEIINAVPKKLSNWLEQKALDGDLIINQFLDDSGGTTMILERTWVRDDTYEYYKSNFTNEIGQSFSALKNKGYIIEEKINVKGNSAKFF